MFNLAVREALRYQYHRRLLGARQQPGDLVLGTAPETLTLGLLHPRPARILYPDPPLGREELEVIAPVAGDTPLVTPLAALASLPRSQAYARSACRFPAAPTFVAMESTASIWPHSATTFVSSC